MCVCVGRGVGGGGETSGRQEAGISWGLLEGLLEELLADGHEEPAADCQEEVITGDKVIRLD